MSAASQPSHVLDGDHTPLTISGFVQSLVGINARLLPVSPAAQQRRKRQTGSGDTIPQMRLLQPWLAPLPGSAGFWPTPVIGAATAVLAAIAALLRGSGEPDCYHLVWHQVTGMQPSQGGRVQ